MARYTQTAQLTDGPAVNQYRLLTECGQGSFCKVQWAEDEESRCCAVKVFERGVLERRQVSKFTEDGATTVCLQERIDEEIRLLHGLEHTNIVPLLEVIDDPNIEQLFVVMEGLPGGQIMSWQDELFAYSLGGASSSAASVGRFWGNEVRSTGAAAASADLAVVYQEAAAAHLMRQLFAGLEYMHARRIVHKDLKPDNVLVSVPVPWEDPRFARLLSIAGWPELRGPDSLPASADAQGSLQELLVRRPITVKVCDFNSAVACPTEDCLIHDAEGTQCFTPPECFDPCRGGSNSGRPRDVWSMGCLLFVFLFGRCPYWNEVPFKMQMDILYGELQLPAGVLSTPAEALVRSLLAKDPKARPTAAESLQDPFLRPAAA